MSKYFSLIYSGEIQTEPEEKIIPSKEFSQLLKGSEVVKQAKEDVKVYLEKNKEECEKHLKKAEEAGFNKGLSEFNQQILCYQEKIMQMEHELQKVILPLVLKAAKKIVGKELELKPEAIVDIVRQAIKPITQNHHIKIFVSKEDKDALEKEKKNLREIFEHIKTFIIEEREDITPGGCIIETEAGIINASLENQWRALESAFEAFMKRT